MSNIFAAVAANAKAQEEAFDNQIKAIKLEIERAEEHAAALVIKSDEDALSASEFLATLEHTVRDTEATRKRMVKPINDGVTAINAEFKKNKKPFEDAIALLKPKILAYKQKRDAELAEQQAEVERQREAAAAESFTTGVMPAVIQDVPTGFIGKSAGVGTRKVWKAEVKELGKVPLKYLQVDQVQLNKDMRELVEQHKQGEITAEQLESFIDGVRIFQDEGLIVS